MLKPFISYFKQLSNQHLILLLTIASIFIAWRLHYIQHGWVNNDFVLYYEAARLFSLGELKQGFIIFKWPLYSLLISGIHNVTGYDLHLSAQILTTGLFALTTYSFLTIINMSNGSRLTLYCGALILFSSTYLTGDVLPMLLRDPGLWAFFLTSLVFFVRFYRTHLWKDALLWQLSAITATLFRVEAITYLVLLPVILLITANLDLKNRLLLVLKAQSINITALLLLIVSLALIPSISISDFGRLQEVWALFDHKYSDAIKEFSLRVNLLEKVVFKGHFDHLGTVALTVALVTMCIIKYASTLGWVNTGLLMYGKNEPSKIDSDTRHILIYVAILSVINSTVILMSVFLLVNRYTAPFALAFMVLAAFALSTLISRLQLNKNKPLGLKPVVAFVIMFMSLSLVKNLLSKQPGYNFQQDAVAWLQSNNPNHKSVFYDDSKVRYFANEPFVGTWGDNWDIVITAIDNQTIQHYHYLLISHSAKNSEREKFISEKLTQYHEIKRFSSPKAKKSIVIYQKRPTP